MYDYAGGLFGMFSDMRICITSCFCPCWMNGQNWAKVRDEDWTFCHCCIFTHPYWTRKSVLRRKGITGNNFADCLVSQFCMCCTVCQDARFLGERGVGSNFNTAGVPINA